MRMYHIYLQLLQNQQIQHQSIIKLTSLLCRQIQKNRFLQLVASM